MNTPLDEKALSVGPKFPAVCDGMEQEVFEACATRMYMDMTIHPLHYIFLNEKTDGMRKGWREAIFYCGRVHSIIVEKMNDNFAAVQAENERLREVHLHCLASLVAAVSLLKRLPKKAAPSDKMFDQMIKDYEAAIENSRRLIAGQEKQG